VVHGLLRSRAKPEKTADKSHCQPFQIGCFFGFTAPDVSALVTK
jgi:hypothetical protein